MCNAHSIHFVMTTEFSHSVGPIDAIGSLKIETRYYQEALITLGRLHYELYTLTNMVSNILFESDSQPSCCIGEFR